MSDNGNGCLPPGWIVTTIGEVAAVVGGGTPDTRNAQNYENGSIPWITPADLSGYTAKYISHGARFITEQGLNGSGARMLPTGTVLFSSRAPIGYVAIALNPVCTNQGFKSFVLPHSIDPEYVYYYLKSAKEIATGLASGTTFLELSGAKAATIPIPIAPTNEQRRIISEIEKQFSRLDAGIAALKRVQANLKRYRASVLRAACEGRLVSTEAELARQEGREYESAERLLNKIREIEYKTANSRNRGGLSQPSFELEAKSRAFSRQGILPVGWTWTFVEELNPSKRSCAYGVLQPGPDVPEGTKLVRVGDIEGGKIYQDNIKRIAPAIASQYSRTKLEGGEVLITLVGAIGRTAVVPINLAGANTARAVGVIPLTKLVNPYWIEIWFRNPTKVNEMTSQAHEVARKTLNLEDVRAATVALPPLAEQERIVAEVERRLSIVDEAEATVKANLKRAERLRQAILQRAFSGKLVPQDPNDEPASVLLERIQAERAASGKSKSDGVQEKSNGKVSRRGRGSQEVMPL